MPEFDNNSAQYYSLTERVRRDTDSYYYYMRTQNLINQDFINSASIQESMELVEDAYQFLQGKEIDSNFVRESYQQIKNYNGNDKSQLMMAIYGFFLSILSYHRNEAENSTLITALVDFENKIRKW